MKTLAVLLLVTACLYLPLRDAPFVYEDENWQGATVMHWTPPPSRALAVWTLQHTLNPRTAHLVNVAIHLSTGTLVYALAATVAGPTAAIVASGLFLLHPLNSEAVSYVSSRTDLLMTFGIVLAVWGALALVGAWRIAAISIGLLIASMSKELGAVGVLLVAMSVAAWQRESRRVLGVLALVLLVGVVIQGARIASWAALESWSGGSSLGWHAYLQAQAYALTRLLSLVVWPVGFTIDHDWLGVSPFVAPWAVLLAVSIPAVAISAWSSSRLLAWGMAWITLSVLPRFLFRTNELLSEHQMYLATVGVCVLIGAGVAHFAALRVRQESFA